MTAPGAGPVDPLGEDLTRMLRTLKLGGLRDTLPERLALARAHKTSHASFLAQILSDEIGRRETHSAAIRAQNAGLHPTMRLDTWTQPPGLTYRHDLLDDLAGLRFLDAGHNVLILGPVGVGKTHLATGIGHVAIRRRHTVHMARADRLFTRLRAARLDNTLDAELRRLTRLDLLILDDFALRPLDAFALNDFYEIVVERDTRKASTIITSNREPAEWLAMTPDSLLSQAAIDRITAAAHHLILEGPSHRQRPT